LLHINTMLLQALLKIVKHCHDSLPHMVTGSLLGLNAGHGVLEVTHAFPFPDPPHPSQSRNNKQDQQGSDDNADNKTDDVLEGHEFQLEMMRMLREVNVDNNCVGWYQSMYLGIFSTSNLLENQLSYQLDLSPNAVVIVYDPIQTRHGNLVLRCYRLSDEVVRLKALQQGAIDGTGSGATSSANPFIDPKTIFEEVPIKLTNPGLATALLADLDSHEQQQWNNNSTGGASTSSVSVAGSAAPPLRMGREVTWDRLDLSTHPYLEKHLEFACNWVDDLTSELHKFQYYARQMNRDKSKRMSSSADAPRRLESLLISNQIDRYCEQMSDFAANGLTKTFVASGMRQHPTARAAPSAAAAP
jgi:translation initiation factor 3 subunit H